MSGNKARQSLLTLATAAVLGGVAAPASAQSMLSLGEWGALPRYCQAGLTNSAYATFIPPDVRPPLEWGRENMPKVNVMDGTHHFCMGLVYLSRAKLGREKFDKAAGEINYSFSRMTRSSSMYSVTSAAYGTALYRSGKRGEAGTVWQRAIATQPTYRESYLAMVEAYLMENRPKEALEVLQKFDAQKEEDFPDVEHFFAQVYFEMQKYGEARKHAERAYDLGYPVFGLREKMKRMGKW